MQAIVTLDEVSALLPRGAVAGIRKEGRPGIDTGLVFLVDLNMFSAPVHGIGTTDVAAIADCQARKGVPYAPCCTREYGMHARTCRGYFHQVSR